MRVRSEKYPELRVVPVGVQFRDGAADVDDEAALAALRRLGGRFGLVVPDPVAPDPVDTEPAEGTADDEGKDDEGGDDTEPAEGPADDEGKDDEGGDDTEPAEGPAPTHPKPAPRRTKR